MTTSDWIALTACIAAFIGLIPAFSQLLHSRKSSKSIAIPFKLEEASNVTPLQSEPEERATLNGFGRALVMTSVALVFGVVEIIIFSAVASMYGVAVNVHTMPTNWTIVFYSLFVIPGLCLLMAIAHFTTMFE